LDIKIITNKYIMSNIGEELEMTLGSYRTVLEKCTDAMNTNSKDNIAKIEEIRKLVIKIKAKIMGASNNLKLINENRNKFDEATKKKQKQLEDAVKTSQETNAREMAELQNKQAEAKAAVDKKIQEIESRSKNELDKKLQNLNIKHKEELKSKMEALTASEESKAALEEQKAKKEAEINRINEENIKQKEANERNMEIKKNELEGAKQSLFQKQEELKGIMTQTADKDKKIEELNNLVTKLQEDLRIQIQKDEGRINELGEEKNRVIEEKLRDIKKANEEHDAVITQLRKDHERQIKELQLKMLTEFEEQKLAAVKLATDEKDRELQEKVSASKSETEIIEQRVAQCNADKERFANQLLNARETIKGLEREYNNQEEDSLKLLETEVRDVGDNLDGLQEQLKVEDLIKAADDTIAQSGIIAGTDPTGSSDDDAGEKETAVSGDDGKKQAPTDLPEGWEEAFHEESGQTYYYNKTTGVSQWEKPTEEETTEMAEMEETTEMGGKAKVDDEKEDDKTEEDDEEHPLEIKKEVKSSAWKNFNKIKLALKTKENFNRGAENLKLQTLLIGKAPKKDSGIVKDYVSNIDDNQLDELTQRIVDPKLHGMVKETGINFQKALKSVINDSSKKHHTQHQEMYFRILKSMIEQHSEYYGYLAEEIDKPRVGFEKTLEQLLTAFHLVWGYKNIQNLYSFGHEKNRDGFKDKDFKKLGEVAIKLWATKGPQDYDAKVSTMEHAPPHIKKDPRNLYRYYHAHDHRQGDAKSPVEVREPLAKAGGFRHGKKSKKQNRRSLKSKLKAKKYSLKSKKRGKNKSKKRRKSIKIRIK